MAETRTWVFAPEVAQTRLETEPQAVGTHQENGLWNYEHAPGCTHAAERIPPRYVVNEAGLTTRAEGTITGSHRGRGKGYRPEPVGGRTAGDHRGHLLPEAGFDNSSLVNVRSNIISEAPGSNLGPKKTIENYARRLADDNPLSVINMVTEPLRHPGQTRPFAVSVWITQDGKAVYGASVLNR